jgi:hypothetical protein
VVHDAFHVLLKNAIEAALGVEDPSKAKVRLQVNVTPRADTEGLKHWFLDIIVENTGGPIPASVLTRLNASEPEIVDRNRNKVGSTGIGVFLSRYQLQEVIGGGADIHIVNAGDDRVQSRLRLPAELIADMSTVIETATTSPAEITGDYLLYVEDEPIHYHPTMDRLEPLARTYNLELAHTTAMAPALEMCGTRVPRIVISDLHIPRRGETGEVGDFRHGIEFLRGLMQRANTTGQRPPIWVLTAEDERTVCGTLNDVDRYGYQFVRHSKDDLPRVAEDGAICVFSGVKRLAELDFLPSLLELAMSRTQQPLAQEKPPPRAYRVPCRVVNMDEDQWEHALADQAEVQSRDSDVAIICQATVSDKKSLASVLSRWTSHPGLPDSDPSSADEPALLYRLHDHVFHRRLVLQIAAASDVMEVLDLPLLYWALSRNLWLATEPLEAAKLASAWVALRDVGTGTLATLRHDLKNLRQREADESMMLDAAIKATRACENRLGVRGLTANALDKCLFRREFSEGQLEAAFDDRHVVADKKSKLGKQLQSLERRLGQFPYRDERVEAILQSHRHSIQTLNDYFEGSQ